MTACSTQRLDSAFCRALTLVFTLMAAVAIGGCPHRPPPVTPPPPATLKAPPEKVTWLESKSGLGFRLSDVDAEPPEHAVARTEPLAAKDVKALLARWPAMTLAPKVKTFALREESLPAPHPGQTLQTPFPPALQPLAPNAPVVAEKPLRIERRAPEGNVTIAPELTVTFSEPMVKLTSHAELEKLGAAG